jgi:hypothetical protein
LNEHGLLPEGIHDCTMIDNDEQLRITHEQLGRMYKALADLRQEVKPVNPRKYAVFSKGFVDQIRRLRAEIDSYLGFNETTLNPESTPADALRENQPPYGPPPKAS